MHSTTTRQYPPPVTRIHETADRYLVYREGIDRPVSISAADWEHDNNTNPWDKTKQDANLAALHNDEPHPYPSPKMLWSDYSAIADFQAEQAAARWHKLAWDRIEAEQLPASNRSTAELFDELAEAQQLGAVEVAEVLRGFLRLRGVHEEDLGGPYWWTDIPDLDRLPPPPAPLLTRDDGQTVVPADRSISIYAPPERGKTWIGFMVALAAIKTGGRAVVVDHEMNVRDCANRFRLLGGYRYVRNPDQFRYLYGPETQPADVEASARWLAARPGSVVVIDSVNRAGGYSTHPTEYLEWADSNVKPYRTKQVGVVLLDHETKTRPAQGSNYQGPMGTGQKVADVDIVLRVDGTPWTTTEPGTITLHRIKDRHGDLPGPPAVASITGDYQDGGFAWRIHRPATATIEQAPGDSSRARRLKRLEKAIVWVRKQPEPVTAFDLAKGIGVGKVTALDYLKELAAGGELTQHTKGRTFVFSAPDDQGILTLPEPT